MKFITMLGIGIHHHSLNNQIGSEPFHSFKEIQLS